MCERLKDRVAIVVGAGQTPGDTLGNGRAIAMLFAREGASVVAVDNRLESAEETTRMIEDEGGKAISLEADVTSPDDCERMAAACVEAYGKIDVLVNNVGIGIGGGPVELSEEDWDKVLATNLTGMFLTCKHVLPHMEKQGKGSIVNISSRASVRFQPYPMLAYSASKGGVNSLTQSIAMQYAHQGIRANVVMPGLIHTPMAIEGVSAGLGIDKEDLIRLRNAGVPMNHMGEAQDIAYAALFLACDESKFITGVVLPLDGGGCLKA